MLRPVKAAIHVNYLFPLFLSAEQFGGKKTRLVNLSPVFTKEIEKRLSMSFVEHEERDGDSVFGARDVFHYIYAITFSPDYRSRYGDFLKRDFAKIPLMSLVSRIRTSPSAMAFISAWARRSRV